MLYSVIAAAAALAGFALIFAIVTYLNRSERLVYKQAGEVIAAASPDKNIVVQHAGDDVPRVARTSIALW